MRAPSSRAIAMTVARSFADWDSLKGKIDLHVVTDYIGGDREKLAWMSRASASGAFV